MNYLNPELPQNRWEHVRQMREHLILQLGLIALAAPVLDIGEVYEEKLDELRAVVNEGIDLKQ